MDIKEEGLIKGDIARHWYYRAKLAAMRRLIGPAPVRALLDVGAGLGFYARALLRDTPLSQAVCIDPGYPADREEVVAGKPLLFRRHLEASPADLVLMMDVLEHVPDDVALAREYVGMVASGTRFVVTVPAFMWLWSGHDVFLEHFRRYALAEIERTLVAAGLRIERGCYFYGALLPLVAATRLAGRLRPSRDAEAASQMREFGPLLNAAFWSVCRAELPLFRFNRLAGLTAMVCAVKP
jgi:hypothetical protein